jgi:uncharacterized protein YbjT (DUF2867 family)
MSISACVVGASGLVGREVVAQLCGDPAVDAVHLMLRRSQGNFGGNPKLVEHVVDFDRMQESAWPACKVLLCCLGTTIKTAGSQQAFRQVDFDYVVKSAQQARRAGATRLMVVSSIGANQQSRVFYSRTKGEMEAAVASLGFRAVLIFRPSILSGHRLEKRPGEHLALAAMKVGSLFLPKKYRPIPARAVARAMVESLHHAQRGVMVIESDKLQQYR